MSNGQAMTMNYAVKFLSFKTITLWSNPAMVTCTAVEAMVQDKLRHQALGQRCHRIEGAGGNGTNQIDFEHEVHHVSWRIYTTPSTTSTTRQSSSTREG